VINDYLLRKRNKEKLDWIVRFKTDFNLAKYCFLMHFGIHCLAMKKVEIRCFGHTVCGFIHGRRPCWNILTNGNKRNRRG